MAASKKITHPYAIHWFRRDLRVCGNEGLRDSVAKYQGRVLGLFVFDKKFLSREDFSWNRFAFFLQTLKELRSELQALGGDLLCLDVSARESFEKIFEMLKLQGTPLPDSVSMSRDYEPFARKRDKEMATYFENSGVSLRSYRDHLVLEPHELTKKDSKDGFYQIYTPFSKRWKELVFQNKEFSHRIAIQEASLKYYGKEAKNEAFILEWKSLHPSLYKEDVLKDYAEKAQSKVTITIPKAGGKTAFQAMQSFVCANYESSRDYPAVSGTSKLSIYFKNGSLTTAQAICALNLTQVKYQKYLNELIWREFYYHILFHVPRVETEAFQTKYKNIAWQNDEKLFEAWKNGETGYPIIDAGMRQLRETGWMHNRVRMIVASFLTKDLLIDWRLGERYFMQTLIDGDLAPNNGGWQWAASTGCDAQPYFRIFNPELQSKKFDPQGEYIRKYVPELKHLSDKEIHSPDGKVNRYPKPIVNHAAQKLRALQLYKI